MFLMNSVMLKLARRNKVQNLTKYDFLPLFYCSATLMLKSFHTFLFTLVVSNSLIVSKILEL